MLVSRWSAGWPSTVRDSQVAHLGSHGQTYSLDPLLRRSPGLAGGARRIEAGEAGADGDPVRHDLVVVVHAGLILAGGTGRRPIRPDSGPRSRTDRSVKVDQVEGSGLGLDETLGEALVPEPGPGGGRSTVAAPTATIRTAAAAMPKRRMRLMGSGPPRQPRGPPPLWDLLDGDIDRPMGRGRERDGVLVQPCREDQVGIAWGGHAGIRSDCVAGPAARIDARRWRVA